MAKENKEILESLLEIAKRIEATSKLAERGWGKYITRRIADIKESATNLKDSLEKAIKEVNGIKNDSRIKVLTLDSKIDYNVMLEVAKDIYPSEAEADNAVDMIKARLENEAFSNADMITMYNKIGGKGSGNKTEINLQRVIEGYMACIR